MKYSAIFLLWAEVTFSSGAMTGWGPFDSTTLCWISIKAYVSVVDNTDIRAGRPVLIECVEKDRP